MSHPLPFVYDVGNVDSAELAGIEGLASGRGVEGGSIEIDPARVIGPVGDHRLEIADVRIGIIESVGHREPGASDGG
jgi:hypothetical protein